MQLKHIILDPINGVHLSNRARSDTQRSDQEICDELLFDVEELVLSVTTLFRGLCPAHTPYFIWSELYPLPWVTKFFRDNGDVSTPLEITDAVMSIYDDLRGYADTHPGVQFPATAPAVTFNLTSYKTDQQQIQGMLVEALLAFDEMLESLDLDEPYRAMTWLSAGYKFLMEAIHLAWPIADKSKAAKTRANARHIENRAMKQDVFTWLDANMRRFKSMDAAAEAIAGKIAPIAWRTARDWVGEWKKLRSAGTP